MSQAISVDQPAKPRRIIHDRPPMLAIGVMIWLGSELMFFSGLFAAFFTIRAQRPRRGRRPGTHLDTIQAGIFTGDPGVVELHHAEGGVRRGAAQPAVRPGSGWRPRSSSGLLFLGEPVLRVGDPAPPGPSTNAYGSLFFIMTGLHGLHVFLGLVAMTFLLGRMKGPAGDPGELSVFQGVSYYWHFVDIVWIGLYSCLFLLK